MTDARQSARRGDQGVVGCQRRMGFAGEEGEEAQPRVIELTQGRGLGVRVQVRRGEGGEEGSAWRGGMGRARLCSWDDLHGL